jgi:Tfp pilus assembly PilM family ATPase
VLDKVGRPRRIGLVLPDVIAKVSLIRFEQVPARAQEHAQLVRWQVRKTAPFPIEEAQVSFVPGLTGSDGHEFIVSLARRDVIAEYEGICAEAGAHAGIVDLATFNVINAVLAGSSPPETDWLLVNMAADSASIAILRGPHLILFRNRGAETFGTLAVLVVLREMFCVDRL